MTTVLITGITGQDAAYLADRLLEDGCEIIGACRRTSGRTYWRLKELDIFDEVEIVDFDLLEPTNICRCIRELQPDEVYNLAAQSYVGTSFEQPSVTMKVNSLGVLQLLEAIRTYSPESRYYQASSSEMFGDVGGEVQDEETRFRPRSPYAVSKAAAHYTTVNYREAYGLFAVSGILFNHESPLRGREFVTRKIARNVAMIARGQKERFELGNLDARRDWGYAGEYVDAMVRMMRAESPDTYVVGMGESHSVREFVEVAFEVVGEEIDWRGEGVSERGVGETGDVLVAVSEEFYRPSDVEELRADTEKARRRLGWEPEVEFGELVEIMVNAELERLSD